MLLRIVCIVLAILFGGLLSGFHRNNYLGETIIFTFVVYIVTYNVLKRIEI